MTVFNMSDALLPTGQRWRCDASVGGRTDKGWKAVADCTLAAGDPDFSWLSKPTLCFHYRPLVRFCGRAKARARIKCCPVPAQPSSHGWEVAENQSFSCAAFPPLLAAAGGCSVRRAPAEIAVRPRRARGERLGHAQETRRDPALPVPVS